MIRSLSCGLVVALAATALAQQPAAEKTPPPENKEQIEAALKLTKEAASKYEFAIGPQNSTPELIAEPILKWSNPSVGEIHGNVFLWTLDGRPAIVSSIFKWFSPHTHMSHEFHSLSEQPVRAKYEGAEVWNTSEPGLKFATLADLPPPAAGKPQRLLQMRDFARACTAIKHDKDGTQVELRLLTQPIYRYESPQAGVIDGALFVFVQGTDPEVFLLVEAREEGGKREWQYAASRMNSLGMDLKHRGREIWKMDLLPSSDIYSHRKPYTSFMHKMP